MTRTWVLAVAACLALASARSSVAAQEDGTIVENSEEQYPEEPAPGEQSAEEPAPSKPKPARRAAQKKVRTPRTGKRLRKGAKPKPAPKTSAPAPAPAAKPSPDQEPLPRTPLTPFSPANP